MSRLKYPLILLIVVVTTAVVYCGQQPPQPIAAAPFQLSQVGQTYNLTLVQGASQWPLGKVPLGGMSLTIQSATQISGSFLCFINGVQNGSAQYTANVIWNSNQTISISGFTANPATCQLNYYFNLDPTMYYAFMGQELELTDLQHQEIVQFLLQ